MRRASNRRAGATLCRRQWLTVAQISAVWPPSAWAMAVALLRRIDVSCLGPKARAEIWGAEDKPHAAAVKALGAAYGAKVLRATGKLTDDVDDVD